MTALADGEGGRDAPEAGGHSATEARLEAPPAVSWIVRTLEKRGFETWAVGGAVRDALLGRPSGDWDLATRARPADLRRAFKRTVPVGIEHGTIGVIALDGIMYEVTTFRRDVETDGRHAVVSFADRIEDDLARRDFTINAIAWHPTTGRILDPFDGQDHLRARVLRTVGEPAERFGEDYLRILRAFRFAGRFDLRIEDETWGAACAAVDHLRGLSVERIRDEMMKVLDDERPSRALGLYAGSGALRVLYPELEARRSVPVEGGQEDVAPSEWELACATVDRLSSAASELRLAALLRGLEATEIAGFLVRLRLSNARIERTLRLATTENLPAPDASPADFRRWLSRTGPGVWEAAAGLQLAAAITRAGLGLVSGPLPDRLAASLARAGAIHDQRPPLSVGDLELDGRDLIRLGLKPGPRFGTILEGLLEWVLDDPARNSHEMLAERVLEEIAHD